jgi:DNA repair protein RadD
MKLRPYQAQAHDAAIQEIKTSLDPCLIDAAPAAGKSFMIAALAKTIHEMSGKRILCTAPSAELVTQNSAKFAMTGERFSIFSASAGRKELRHNVVFGTPGTIKNRISHFKRDYGAVIIDECHGLTPTIKNIIEQMREGNPNLRVIGLSGTPFRLGEGYVFRIHPDGRVNDDSQTRDPYFGKCVIRVSPRQMLDEGFITPMDIGEVGEHYDTSGLVEKGGKFTDESLYQTFVGQGRLTSQIVASVVDTARHMYGGCMLFAATVQHAKEIMESLPPGNSGIVTGEEAEAMGGAVKGRKSVIEAYRDQRFKFLVSVGTLTTGFDVEHTSLIATLRRTESAALLQQILGRAWRLDPQKPRSLWLDFAENADKHFPDGDIYSPKIEAKRAKEKGEGLQCECPDCGYENTFSANPDYQDFQVDRYGYCLDLAGNQVMTEYGPLSAHYGRRCFGMHKTGGTYERCGYRWTSKECPECGEPNDIAARYCCKCRAEIVNPNEKLAADFKRLKRDPTKTQTDVVLSMDVREGVSQKGNRTVRVDFVTEYRSFSIWFVPESKGWKQRDDWARFNAATDGCARHPRTVTYCKDAESGFYRLVNINQEEDRAPEQSAIKTALEAVR